MAINFPSSPILGQTVNVGNKVYAWNGVGWEIPMSAPGGGGGGGTTVTTDDNAPSIPKDGELWWKSNTGVFYIYYDDGNTKQWVEAAAPAGPSLSYVLKTARRTNLVINGALNVSQENSNTEGTASQYYAADQMLGAFSAAGAAFGISRVAAVNPSGSQWRLQFRVITAKASLAAGDLAGPQTRLEGFTIQDLGWGGAAPKDAVLQFGFKGPAGTYCVAIRNGAATHSFIAAFTISAGQANVDTAQIIRVPAPPGSMLTWTGDTTIGLYLDFTLAAGTTLQAPTTGWNSGNFIGVTGMSNGLAAVQSFQVWDIGLHADPDKTGLAPAFEVSDYNTELLKCQRYWQKVFTLFSGDVTSTGTYIGATSLLVLPRTTPSLTGVNSGVAGFPATVGTLIFTTNTVYEQRTANANLAGVFDSIITVNARM